METNFTLFIETPFLILVLPPLMYAVLALILHRIPNIIKAVINEHREFSTYLKDLHHRIKNRKPGEPI